MERRQGAHLQKPLSLYPGGRSLRWVKNRGKVNKSVYKIAITWGAAFFSSKCITNRWAAGFCLDPEAGRKTKIKEAEIEPDFDFRFKGIKAIATNPGNLPDICRWARRWTATESINLGDRDAWAWTTCPQLLFDSGLAGSWTCCVSITNPLFYSLSHQTT